MVYSNIFPSTYQPTYPSMAQMPMQHQQAQSQGNNIIWVTGEAGAKSYLVAPNTTVQLWDSEAQVIYLKSADASGMPSIKVLDYTVRDAQNANLRAFSDNSELTEIKNRISALEAKMEGLKNDDE